MESIEILGLVAGILTTSAFVPQVYKSWIEKSTRDISVIMYLVIVAGTVLWFIYGLYHESLAIILANGVTAILAATMVVLKLMYK